MNDSEYSEKWKVELKKQQSLIIPYLRKEIPYIPVNLDEQEVLELVKCIKALQKKSYYIRLYTYISFSLLCIICIFYNQYCLLQITVLTEDMAKSKNWEQEITYPLYSDAVEERYQNIFYSVQQFHTVEYLKKCIEEYRLPFNIKFPYRVLQVQEISKVCRDTAFVWNEIQYIKKMSNVHNLGIKLDYPYEPKRISKLRKLVDEPELLSGTEPIQLSEEAVVVMVYEVTEHVYHSIHENKSQGCVNCAKGVYNGDQSYANALRFANKLSTLMGFSECYSESRYKDPFLPRQKYMRGYTFCEVDSCDGWKLPTIKQWISISTKVNNLVEIMQEEQNSSSYVVGQYDKTTTGMFDLTGNLYEITWDWKTNPFIHPNNVKRELEDVHKYLLAQDSSKDSTCVHMGYSKHFRDFHQIAKIGSCGYVSENKQVLNCQFVSLADSYYHDSHKSLGVRYIRTIQ